MKTKVVHIISGHSPLDSRVFYKECRSLARAGYEVVLLGAHDLNETRDGVVLRGVGKSRGLRHRMTTTLAALCREAFRLKADVYHIHDSELLLINLLLRLAGKRVVYDIHEDLPRTIHYKQYIPRWMRPPLIWAVEAIENLSARCMSGLITATPTINERFARIRPDAVTVNNFPLQDELVPATANRWQSRDMAVGYIGGSSEVRGIRQMLQAMDLLPSNLNAHLELAGHFSPAGLQHDVEATPEWKHVRWRGKLDRNGVCALLGRVRAGLVLFHPEENFVCSQPIKFFEYMSAGIPLIVSDFPLWRSIVEESGCGLLVDPLNPKAIAKAIELLLTDSKLAETMGQRGRRAVEQRYNWNTEEKTLLNFYSSILSTSELTAARGATVEI